MEYSTATHLIVDLRQLNHFIDAYQFCMLMVAKVVLPSIQGLGSSYIGMCQLLTLNRHFLAIQVRGLVLQFTVLAFGLNVALQVFTTITKSGQGHCLTEDILAFTCLEFLLRALSSFMTPQVVDDVLCGHRDSSHCQYGSCW